MSQAPVTVTDRAFDRIRQIAAGEGAGTMLRVSVEGGGCSGFQYKFDLVREQAGEDVVLGEGPARVLIDPISLGFMQGSQIDYVDDLIGASFKIKNPNAKASCGCGTSFTM